jgi:2-polyprenyl-3-methyl-5-hydroxy-6-metoxy-1,4-benzoquinol methylase
MSLEKTTVAHWNEAWARGVRARLPSSLDINVRNYKALLSPHVQPGTAFLEIGFAPGKMLAWVAQRLGAVVTGVDYSPRGVEVARGLFQTLGLAADLRCESIFETTLQPASFDVVYSAGVIEHFEDPRQIVARHVDLLRPGGIALIHVPNYGGLYGSLQGKLDPDNLALHNLRIMSLAALRALAPQQDELDVNAYTWGRMSPWILSLPRLRIGRAGTALSWALNGLAQLQPFKIDLLAPMLVLEIRKRPKA